MTTAKKSKGGKHLDASPHGEFEEVFPGVFVVRGGIRMPMLIPMKGGRSMTVVRGEEGALTLFNSMRLSEAGLKELEAVGRVAHVVRVGGFHGRDDAFYRERFGAKVHAIRGQRYVRGLGKEDPNAEPYLEPDVWLDEESELPVAEARIVRIAGSEPPEAIALLEREGGILITGDSLWHTPAPDSYFNLPARLMMGKMGFFKPHNVGPGWLKFAKPSAAGLRSILDLPFEHVLPGHGIPVIGGAREKYRPAIEEAMKACHT